jgi:hypothetical protein
MFPVVTNRLVSATGTKWDGEIYKDERMIIGNQQTLEEKKDYVQARIRYLATSFDCLGNVRHLYNTCSVSKSVFITIEIEI